MTTAPAAERDLHRAPPWWLDAMLALGLLLAIVAIAMLRGDGTTLLRGSDAVDIMLSYFHDASRAIEADGLLAAMYTPGVLAGLPQWSSPHLHPLYPFYFNWIGADADVVATLQRLNRVGWLHLGILGSGGYVLARSIGVRVLPALCVGLVLPWFPAVASASRWTQILAGLAWLPWVLAFQARLYEARDRRQVVVGIVGLVLSATLLVYAQPAQNLVFAVVASAIAWVLLGAHAVTSGDRQLRARHVAATGWLGISALLVALATAGYLLEVLRFHAGSIRWLGAFGGSVSGGEPLPLGALRLHGVPLAEAWRVLAFEDRRGIGHAYLGAAMVAGAVVMAARRGPPAGRALAVTGLLALLACFAVAAPVLHALPLAGQVREILWWSCLATICLVPSAAAALQGLGDQRVTDRIGRAVPAWFAAGLVAALAAALLAPPAHRVEALASLVAGFAAVGWLLLGRPARSPLRDAAVAVVLLAAVWMPLRHVARFALHEATVFSADRVQARADARLLIARLPDVAAYRVALDPALPGSDLLVHSYMTQGVRLIRGGISPADRARFELLHFPTPAIAALYGVKYTVLPAASRIPGDTSLRPGLVVRTDPRALPQVFFLAGALQVVEDPAAALRTMPAASTWPLLVATDALPPGSDRAALSAGDTTLTLPAQVGGTLTRVRATIDTTAPGVLVLNEDPGARWQARSGDAVLPVFGVNGFQTGVVLARPGRHEVVFERPGPLFGRSGP